MILAAFDGPARAVRCASAIVEGAGRRGMVAKAGLHTGECDVHPDGLRGTILDIARRVAAVAKGGEVIVSGTVRDLIAGSGIAFAPRGGLAAGRAAERRPLFAGGIAGLRRPGCRRRTLIIRSPDRKAAETPA
jgi:class 3 adenylate cyclase